MDEEALKELKEQTKWIRFLALPNLKRTIEQTIITKEQKNIYGLSDGSKSTNEISKKLLEEGLKVSHMTVYNYWKRWFALGLVVPSKVYSGRFEKIVDLADLGIVQ